MVWSPVSRGPGLGWGLVLRHETPAECSRRPVEVDTLAGMGSPCPTPRRARGGEPVTGAVRPRARLPAIPGQLTASLTFSMTPSVSPSPLLATTPPGCSGHPSLGAQLRRDLGDLLGCVVGCEHVGLGGEVHRRDTLGRLVNDLELFAGLGVRAVEDRGELQVVAEREAIEAAMVAALDMRLALGNLVGGDPRARGTASSGPRR